MTGVFRRKAMKTDETNHTEVESSVEESTGSRREEVPQTSEVEENPEPTEGSGEEGMEAREPVRPFPDDPEGPVGDELEVLQADMDQLRDQYLRLAADFENYRKRVTGELASGWTRAQADLAESLLEGLDDLQRVSRFTTEDTTLESLIEGVDLVERKLMKALIGAGLEVFDPAGEVFDPNTMEAMMRVPTEEPGQDETVHQVFQKGYLFKDQLLRPARVSVYKDED